MKRYLLFAGHCYYPMGGFSDFQGSFDSLGEAVKHFETLEFNSYVDHWGQLVDSVAWKVVNRLRQDTTNRGLSLRSEVKIICVKNDDEGHYG